MRRIGRGVPRGVYHPLYHHIMVVSNLYHHHHHYFLCLLTSVLMVSIAGLLGFPPECDDSEEKVEAVDPLRALSSSPILPPSLPSPPLPPPPPSPCTKDLLLFDTLSLRELFHDRREGGSLLLLLLLLSSLVVGRLKMVSVKEMPPSITVSGWKEEGDEEGGRVEQW